MQKRAESPLQQCARQPLCWQSKLSEELADDASAAIRLDTAGEEPYSPLYVLYLSATQPGSSSNCTALY